jgi:hypothetical protein
MGSGSAAEGGNSIAAGAYSEATGDTSLAIGYIAKASGGFSVAIGSNTNAEGVRSVAIGTNALANIQDSFAIGTGRENSAIGNYAIQEVHLSGLKDTGSNFNISNFPMDLLSPVYSFALADKQYSLIRFDVFVISKSTSASIGHGSGSFLAHKPVGSALAVSDFSVSWAGGVDPSDGELAVAVVSDKATLQLTSAPSGIVPSLWFFKFRVSDMMPL